MYKQLILILLIIPLASASIHLTLTIINNTTFTMTLPHLCMDIGDVSGRNTSIVPFSQNTFFVDGHFIVNGKCNYYIEHVIIDIFYYYNTMYQQAYYGISDVIEYETSVIHTSMKSAKYWISQT